MVFVRKKTRYDKKAQLRVTEWTTKHGILHRTGDKPARIWEDGRKEWWFNGALHRNQDKPAILDEADADGQFLEEYYFKGNLHRYNDKPASSRYDGKVYRWEWYKHGLKHRDGDLPAVVVDRDGRKLTKIWFKDGRKHRINGPAITITQPLGSTTEKWFYYGKLHRQRGHPAVIVTHIDGIDKAYYEHGEQYECFRLFGILISWSLK